MYDKFLCRKGSINKYLQDMLNSMHFENIINCGLLLTDISTHFLIFQFFLAKISTQRKLDVRMKCRKFTKRNENSFKALME